jgi:hypothetical protein
LAADAAYLTTLLQRPERGLPRAEKTLALAQERLGLGKKVVSSLGVSRQLRLAATCITEGSWIRASI